MERDFRVRAFLYIQNEGRARGLYNHIQGVMSEAVDINPETPQAEMKQLDINDSWTIAYDLCYPFEFQSEAEGLFNHTKNIAINHAIKLPGASELDEAGFVSIERCGHRTKQSCELIERYEVV